jgi:uncharacterized protein YjbJ (UPF0337 family)
MGEFKDRAKAAVDETMGKAKRAVGEALDRSDIKAQGDAQEAKGDAETMKAKAEHALK